MNDTPAVRQIDLESSCLEVLKRHRDALKRLETDFWKGADRSDDSTWSGLILGHTYILQMRTDHENFYDPVEHKKTLPLAQNLAMELIDFFHNSLRKGRTFDCSYLLDLVQGLEEIVCHKDLVCEGDQGRTDGIRRSVERTWTVRAGGQTVKGNVFDTLSVELAGIERPRRSWERRDKEQPIKR